MSVSFANHPFTGSRLLPLSRKASAAPTDMPGPEPIPPPPSVPR